MARRLYANNARCRLGSDIVTTSPIATVILETGQGGLFPTPVGGDYFYLTVENDLKEVEIFKITTRTGDICSVADRGVEGTVNKTFTASTSIARVSSTKETYDGIYDHVQDTVGAHAATAISFAPTGMIVGTDVQAALAELDGYLTAHLTDTIDAHDASAISVTPTGGLASTDVQAGLQEHQTDIDLLSSVQGQIISGAQIVGNATLWAGRTLYVSTSSPSGGVAGDIWLQYA